MSDTTQRYMPLVVENQRSQRGSRRNQPLSEALREAIPGPIAARFRKRLTASRENDSPCPQRLAIGEIDRKHTVRACQRDDTAAGADRDVTPCRFRKQGVEHGARPVGVRKQL